VSKLDTYAQLDKVRYLVRIDDSNHLPTSVAVNIALNILCDIIVDLTTPDCLFCDSGKLGDSPSQDTSK